MKIISNETLISEITIEEGLIKKTDFNNSFLITNTTLKKLYPDIIKKFNEDKVIVIEDGEKYKNSKTLEFILNELLKRKIERKDTICALGGGVVGDITGYAASSVLRGVNLVQIPTTLLAMCDSSIGGKTGINSKYGKNLIGSFYLAKKVLIDPEFLKTLNEYEFKCGLGEIVKYAFIEKSCKNEEFFNLIEYLSNCNLEQLKENITYVIECCAKLKANVVQIDRLEGGLRKILNLGHTYAHPIETLSNYKNISHGEAVAFGIKYASNLALNLGKIDKSYHNQINNILNKYNLIDKKLSFKKQDIVDLMYRDKKVEDSKINLIIPNSPACVELAYNIEQSELEASLL